MNLIVVGVSRSESSRRALGWAARRAAEIDATLHVVTVVPEVLAGGPPDCFMAPMDWGQPTNPRVERWQRAIIDEELSSLTARPPVTTMISGGFPSQVLSDEAAAADMLVLGATRRRFRWTIRRCQAKVTCPVVVISGDQPQ